MELLSWNCACRRCLAGDCCAYPPASFMTTTAITASDRPRKRCLPTEHDFQSVASQGGLVRLYCRKCGTTREL